MFHVAPEKLNAPNRVGADRVPVDVASVPLQSNVQAVPPPSVPLVVTVPLHVNDCMPGVIVVEAFVVRLFVTSVWSRVKTELNEVEYASAFKIVTLSVSVIS